VDRDSDLRRLGRWLAIVGTVAAIVIGLVTLLVVFGGGEDEPQAVFHQAVR
jgi:hypothetical protein